MMHRNPERVAWATLLAAQAVFILLACGATLAGRWFFLQSNASIEAQIKVGRGTVGIRNPDESNEDAVRVNRMLSDRQIIATDEIAQGYIEFVDTSNDGRIIAEALLLPGSQVQFWGGDRPRFNFADRDYRIDLTAFQGRLEINVPPQLPRAIEINVTGQLGTVHITQSGMYLLWAQADSMTVIPRGAEAHLQQLGRDTVSVGSGQTGTLSAADNSIRVTNSTYELVRNPLFTERLDPATLPSEWGCYQDPQTGIRGTQTYRTIEGRRALRLHREGESIGPSASGCLQVLGDTEAGLDVTGYSKLRVRVTMDIRWHSLAVCGVAGSECPIMLEITYYNQQNQLQRWIHGFYSYDHGDAGVPRTCNSCLLEHDRILPGAWYTYESGNLFELPQAYRPSRITQIRFYTSGHEYETLISEVSLLAEP